MDERIYEFFAASLQDGYIGKLTELVEKAGGARKLYEMKDYEIEKRLGVTGRMCKHIINIRESHDFEQEFEDMMRKNIWFVTYQDDKYPIRLRDIASKPYALFVRGSLPEEERKSVAIIGSRECTEYGRLMSEYFANRLAKANVDIISGMAWGIDGIAQMAALNAGGRSYGVLGCGVDIIYPKKNYRVYERLIENGSGVISEYPPGSEALSRKFPPRNRIIAGLADVLIVVEARQKSGTLITVDMAMDQGKTVMVIPGRLTDPLSVGCLNLISEGAIPVINIEGILAELGLNVKTKNYGQADITGEGLNDKLEDVVNNVMNNLVKSNELSEDEIQLANILGIEPQTAEDISIKTGWNITRTLAVISKLEMKGIVRELGFGLFVRKIKAN